MSQFMSQFIAADGHCDCQDEITDDCKWSPRLMPLLRAKVPNYEYIAAVLISCPHISAANMVEIYQILGSEPSKKQLGMLSLSKCLELYLYGFSTVTEHLQNLNRDSYCDYFGHNAKITASWDYIHADIEEKQLYGLFFWVLGLNNEDLSHNERVELAENRLRKIYFHCKISPFRLESMISYVQTMQHDRVNNRFRQTLTQTIMEIAGYCTENTRIILYDMDWGEESSYHPRWLRKLAHKLQEQAQTAARIMKLPAELAPVLQSYM